MFKTKLFALICSCASVVTFATTAITLAVSGPRNTQSLHMLSDNNAVAYGITNLITGNGSDFPDTIDDIVDTFSDDKTAVNLTATINDLGDGYEDLAGLGASFGFEYDSDSDAFLVDAHATLSSIELIGGSFYADGNQVLLSMPALFDGVIKAPLDNIFEDLNNSYIGSLLAEDGFSVYEFLDELESAGNEFSTITNTLTSIDFDYEDYLDGLMDTIEDSYFDATDNMTVDSLGKKPLSNGKKYQCYNVKLPIADLSYIVKEAIIYSLNDDEFTSFLEDIMMLSQPDAGYGSMGYGAALSQTASMIETYWDMSIVPQFEQVFGENIEFTIYLDNSVRVAGLDFYAGITADETITYNKNADALASINIHADMTGGKNTGDYTYIRATLTEGDYEEGSFVFDSKSEPNGDFSSSVFVTTPYSSAGFTSCGSFVNDAPYFSYDIDSFKYIVDEEVICDLGFSLSFSEIDKISKPSASPVYNIFEMDEDDYMDLMYIIEDNFNSVESILNSFN